MRQLDPLFAAQLERGILRTVIFAHLDFPNGEARAHSWTGSFTWGGHDWLGVGVFGMIKPAIEGRASAAKRLILSLTGPPAALAADLGQPIRNRAARLYLGLLDETGALAGTPDLMLAGVMDARRFTIADAGDGRTVHALAIEVSTGASPRRPGASVHSFDDQIAEQPGDTAGRHLVDQPEQVVLWPE